MAPRMSQISSRAGLSLGWTNMMRSVCNIGPSLVIYLDTSTGEVERRLLHMRQLLRSYDVRSGSVPPPSNATMPKLRHRRRTSGSRLLYPEWPKPCRVRGDQISSWISYCYFFPSICPIWNSGRVLPDLAFAALGLMASLSRRIPSLA